MYAIVSLLDEQHYNRIENLWHDLEVECGLSGVTLTPLPHFSWHIANEYDYRRLEASLQELAAKTQPFSVRTAGLGLFTGASPVLFIPIVKDSTLADFHLEVWQRSQTTAIGASPHYAPEAWVPHITLAYGDVDAVKLGCAMEQLAMQPFNWEIRVDNITVVYSLSGQVGKLQARFMLGG